MRPPSDPAPSAFPERCDYERKYRPDQLREPPGAPDHHGGRFASEGGGGGGSGRRASTPRDQSLGDLAATYESSGRAPARSPRERTILAACPMGPTSLRRTAVGRRSF